MTLEDKALMILYLLQGKLPPAAKGNPAVVLAKMEDIPLMDAQMVFESLQEKGLATYTPVEKIERKISGIGGGV